MKNIYVLVPTLQMTQEIIRELTEVGFEGSRVHVIGQRLDKIQKIHLHEANIMQTSDLIPSLKRGLIIGLAGSVVICGIYSFIVFSKTMKINPYVIPLILISGAILGAWMSSLIGVSVKDPILEKYEEYVKNGYYILMIEPHNVSDIEIVNTLLKHHPGAKIA